MTSTASARAAPTPDHHGARRVRGLLGWRCATNQRVPRSPTPRWRPRASGRAPTGRGPLVAPPRVPRRLRAGRRRWRASLPVGTNAPALAPVDGTPTSSIEHCERGLPWGRRCAKTSRKAWHGPSSRTGGRASASAPPCRTRARGRRSPRRAGWRVGAQKARQRRARGTVAARINISEAVPPPWTLRPVSRDGRASRRRPTRHSGRRSRRCGRTPAPAP